MRIAPPLVTSVFVVGRAASTLRLVEKMPIVAGRSRENQVILDDSLVGHRHLRLLRDEDDGLCVEDLGSANGTYVNGKKIQRVDLHVGDQIQIGRSFLRFAHRCEPAPLDDPDAHAPFLRAILAAPREDGPREVYADWLGERGDPRGEFIQCQLGGHEQRAAEIFAAHGSDWLDLPRPVESWRFARGFIEWMRICTLEGPNAPANLAERHPLLGHEWIE